MKDPPNNDHSESDEVVLLMGGPKRKPLPAHVKEALARPTIEPGFTYHLPPDARRSSIKRREPPKNASKPPPLPISQKRRATEGSNDAHRRRNQRARQETKSQHRKPKRHHSIPRDATPIIRVKRAGSRHYKDYPCEWKSASGKPLPFSQWRTAPLPPKPSPSMEEGAPPRGYAPLSLDPPPGVPPPGHRAQRQSPFHCMLTMCSCGIAAGLTRTMLSKGKHTRRARCLMRGMTMAEAQAIFQRLTCDACLEMAQKACQLGTTTPSSSLRGETSQRSILLMAWRCPRHDIDAPKHRQCGRLHRAPPLRESLLSLFLWNMLCPKDAMAQLRPEPEVIDAILEMVSNARERREFACIE